MRSVLLSDILKRDKNNFDMVRILAAASVIVSHAYFLPTGLADTEPLETLSVFSLSQHAVNIFFILSGVLVSASLDRNKGLVTFASARLLRIFPALIVCIFLTVFVMGALVTTLTFGDYITSSQTWIYVAGAMALSAGALPLPGVFENLPVAGSINVPLWTLKYEVFCYALLAGLGILGIWRRPVLLWSMMGAVLIVHLFFYTPREIGDHGLIDHLVRFITCFFLGAAAYRLKNWLRLSLPLSLLACVILAVAWKTPAEQFFSYLVTGYLALCVGAIPMEPIRKVFSKADISYGLYIYGWPISQLWLLTIPGLGGGQLAILSLGAAAILATLSWFFVEKPALAIKRAAPDYTPPASGR